MEFENINIEDVKRVRDYGVTTRIDIQDKEFIMKNNLDSRKIFRIAIQNLRNKVIEDETEFRL